MTVPEDADEWFVNLETLANRVTSTHRRMRRAQLRSNVLALFVLFAFLLLAWRSELSDNRITRNSQGISQEAARISMTQRETCASSQAILLKFNALQDELSTIEREAQSRGLPYQDLRQRRIAAYEKARVLPLPICEEKPR